MLSLPRFLRDIAHKQVNNGYSKKYADNWDRIYGKKKTVDVKQSDRNAKETPKKTA
jgi:hypothetical protein